MELLEQKRRAYLVFFILGIFCITLGVSSLWIFDIAHAQNIQIPFISPLATILVTPTPDDMYERVQKTHTSDHYPPNEYFPSTLVPRYTLDISVTAEAYAVMDLDTGELLFAKNLTKRHPIASITKVMTAMITLEHIPLDQVITVSPHAALIGEASMGLSAKEKVTVEELLYGAMLPSGNDAAETLAEGVGKYLRHIPLEEVDGGGSRQYFIHQMNKKAQDLGMLDTYYFNPTGLDEEDVEHSTFSTPLDLLALGNYALRNATFSSIVNTRSKHIEYKEAYHKEFYIENILTLSDAYKGIEGIKPGSSIFAKETLLSYVNRNGRRVIAVVLGSEQTKDDVVKIYTKLFGT